MADATPITEAITAPDPAAPVGPTSYESMTRTSDRPSAETTEPTERIDLGTMSRVEWKPPKPEDGGREIRIRSLLDSGKPQRAEPVRASAALAEQARARAAERASAAEAQARFESDRAELLSAQAAGRDPTQTRAYHRVLEAAGRVQQAQAQQVQQAVERIASNPEYEAINALGRAAEVPQLVEGYYRQHAVVLTFDQAADMLENYYRGEVAKLRGASFMQADPQQDAAAFADRKPIGADERMRRARAAMSRVSQRVGKANALFEEAAREEAEFNRRNKP